MASIGFVWGRKRATQAWALGKARRKRDELAGKSQPVRPPRPWEVQKQKKVE